MYATPDDMRARYGDLRLAEICGHDGWNDQVVARLNLALADATALADGYVAKYHGAPAAGRAVPPLLIRLVCEIAFADLRAQPNDEDKARRAAAIDTLKDVAKGLVKLDEGQMDLPARPGALIVPDAPRTFSRQTLDGF